MKTLSRLSSVAVLALSSMAVPSHAQLIGVVQNFPDTTATASPYIFFDHDAINSTTGLLRLVSGAAQLAEGAATGGSTTTQSYFGTGDSIPDVLLSMQIRNGTGGFTAGELVSGTVSIGFGNSTTAPRWKWDGVISQLGFVSGTGTFMDAIWTVTGDQYQNMPANMDQFLNSSITGRPGGIKITTSANWGTTANFTNDWVFGSNPASNTNLNTFRVGMTSPLQIDSTITTDFFVTTPIPEPATNALMLMALAVIAPLAWKRKDKNQ